VKSFYDIRKIFEFWETALSFTGTGNLPGQALLPHSMDRIAQDVKSAFAVNMRREKSSRLNQKVRWGWPGDQFIVPRAGEA
jgi:hypothetical protein